jgi:hypothetical protein
LCPRFSELDACAEEVALKHEAWATVEGWQRDVGAWMQLQLPEVAPAELEDRVLQYYKAACRLERGLGHLGVRSWRRGCMGHGLCRARCDSLTPWKHAVALRFQGQLG